MFICPRNLFISVIDQWVFIKTRYWGPIVAYFGAYFVTVGHEV